MSEQTIFERLGLPADITARQIITRLEDDVPWPCGSRCTQPEGDCIACEDELITACFQREREKAVEEEQIRWQDRLNWIHLKYGVDGSGCDSGDPLDLTATEVHALAVLLDDEREAHAAEKSYHEKTRLRLAAIEEQLAASREAHAATRQRLTAEKRVADVARALMYELITHGKGDSQQLREALAALDAPVGEPEGCPRCAGKHIGPLPFQCANCGWPVQSDMDRIGFTSAPEGAPDA